MKTRTIKVRGQELGRFKDGDGSERLGQWEVQSGQSESFDALEQAAQYLREKDIPVAFPTETVYGLGADATRSGAVKGIYSVKGRPSDNPLIVHVCDLEMLRGLLKVDKQANGSHDSIPAIYKPLIEKFWPGPLTILLTNPQPSKLAPEVTAGLSSFAVRMPSSPLALSLIKLANLPLAAPSANASTKPSPTTAQHVLEDLEGRIELILDAGHCQVGVESTVVDGLCNPPVVLRPGGVSMDDLRSCPGWEGVVNAYKDQSESGAAAPRAPGMKYKHYSPKARVVLYESSCKAGHEGIVPEDLQKALMPENGEAIDPNSTPTPTIRKIGIIRTRRWKISGGLPEGSLGGEEAVQKDSEDLDALPFDVREGALHDGSGNVIATILDIGLGTDIESIAHGLFSALRELDRNGADVVFVDGVEDAGDIGAAVMNRLRKAASEIRP